MYDALTAVSSRVSWQAKMWRASTQPRDPSQVGQSPAAREGHKPGVLHIRGRKILRENHRQGKTRAGKAQYQRRCLNLESTAASEAHEPCWLLIRAGTTKRVPLKVRNTRLEGTMLGGPKSD